MISKPAVLSTFPAMILVALVSKSRFRLITISVVLLCIAQFVNIYISHSAGGFSTVQTFSTTEKIIATGKFFLGLLGVFSTGTHTAPEFYRPIWLGVFALLLTVLIIGKKRTNASALILTGLSMLFFNVLLNAFALSDAWNIRMENLLSVPLYRHIAVGYFGVILVMTGMIGACVRLGKLNRSALAPALAPYCFCFGSSTLAGSHLRQK